MPPVPTRAVLEMMQVVAKRILDVRLASERNRFGGLYERG